MSDRVGAVRLAFDGPPIAVTPDTVAAFSFGLAYGAALERERVDAEDDMIHRAAVETIRRHVGWVDARDV